jgi:predicted lipoprotein with Yx(FWY)xxD motif
MTAERSVRVAEIERPLNHAYRSQARRHSACSRASAAYWPPLVAHGKPTASGGAKQSLIGTIKRANGTRQA